MLRARPQALIWLPPWGIPMTKSTDMQTVMAEFLEDYQHTHRMNLRQLQVSSHIGVCRTEALGGLQMQCDQCDVRLPHYHSCRDRHCPKCQQQASEKWRETQLDAVLPVTDYHVVFTLPHLLNPWMQLHPEVIVRVLFQVVWETLKAFGQDPKRLGGDIGMTAVLHTWGQTLTQHVHLHCLIPGGALTQKDDWHPAKSNYLFPVRALSRHFRGRMVSALRKAAQQGDLSRIKRDGDVDSVLNQLMATHWVVYSKACLNRTQTVVNYLAQYTHRIAISDWRILGIEGDHVHFRYKDYQDESRKKVMSLSATEFIRRFLLHVLPHGLMRIRHYGFLANRCRKSKLETIRARLNYKTRVDKKETLSKTSKAISSTPGEKSEQCPKCHQGHLQVIYLLLPKPLTGG